MSFRRMAASGVVFLLLTAGLAQAHHHHHAKDASPAMGIVTGPPTGTYIAFGRDIARVAAKYGLTINVFGSNGSIDNIKRITSKEKVGLAIVQSDVLGFLSRAKNPESVAVARKLRLVAPFYSEEVHILGRSTIAALGDLQGKRVVVGSQGSGSMITAVNIFSTLGITPGKMYEVAPPRGVVAVLNGDADAMIFVGGAPVRMFKNMEALENITQGPNAGKLAGVHFVPINDARLLKEYKPATLTHADYDYITQDVPTIAVTAVLISYDYTMKDERYYHKQCSNMATLARALRDNLDALKATGHPKWKEVDLNADVALWKRDACSQKVFSEPKKPAASANVPQDSDNTLEKDLIGVAAQHPRQP